MANWMRMRIPEARAVSIQRARIEDDGRIGIRRSDGAGVSRRRVGLRHCQGALEILQTGRHRTRSPGNGPSGNPIPAPAGKTTTLSPASPGAKRLPLPLRPAFAQHRSQQEHPQTEKHASPCLLSPKEIVRHFLLGPEVSSFRAPRTEQPKAPRGSSRGGDSFDPFSLRPLHEGMMPATGRGIPGCPGSHRLFGCRRIPSHDGTAHLCGWGEEACAA